MNAGSSRALAFAPLVAALLALTACAASAAPAPANTGVQTTVGARSTASPAGTSAGPQPSTLPAGMTIRQLAGQRVVYSYAGLTPPASLLTRIRAGEVGGVIFFKSNYRSVTQFKAAVAALKKASTQSPHKRPLLLLTDQEGGLVRRLPGAPTPSEKWIGQQVNPSAAAAAAGKAAAANLAAYGLNVNLAPVLDVFAARGDFIDANRRSYSSNPLTVGALGDAFIRAQQSGGVAATAKHFPGLGSAPFGSNTDLRPVTLSRPLETLRTVDEVPYRTAIAAGVRLVMLSWAVYPALDSKRPAGLSPEVVRELREGLGYRGVIVSDALEAKALGAFGSAGDRALLAAEAGVDLILCSSLQVSQGDAAIAALVAGWESGRLDHKLFEAAAERVTALR